MGIEIELEKSHYINHRNELMKTLEIPKLSEAKSTLGEPLATIVFDECDNALKAAFGLEPPLEGVKGDLWVSPSNLLRGKIALTPPHTRKHIQALTHEGIITIGAGIERKFLNEMNMEKATSLAAQKKNLLNSFQDSIKAEIKDVEARERAACQREIDRITQEFQLHLADELHSLELKLKRQYETSAESQEYDLQKKWEEKLRVEVTKTVKKMTQDFLDELARQETIMMKHFKSEMRKKEIQRQYDIGKQQAKYRSNIDQLRHNLECKNIANMMYVLCMERRKCCKEKQDLEQHYKAELDQLNSVVSQKDREISELESKMKQRVKEVNLRETCILEIIRQFQKFINFALRAAPTQAEFLLSIEKMMVFELTDAILRSSVPIRSGEPCGETIPWITHLSPDTTKVVADLVIEDYHNCLKELPPPKKEGEDQFLPAFHFKDKLYVREDFRNMISQGIDVSPSNELWNDDVQILIDTLKKSLRNSRVVEAKEPQKTLDTILVDPSRKSLRSHSTIQFKLDGEETVNGKPYRRVSISKETASMALKKTTLEIERSSLRTIDDSIPHIDFTKVGQEENKRCILSTRSSLELIMKKGSVRYIGKKDDSEEDLDYATSYEKESVTDFETKDVKDSKKVSSFEAESVRQRFSSMEQQAEDKKSSSVNDGYLAMTSRYSEPNSISPFEYKNNTDPSNQSVKELVLDTRDSIILRQVTLSKDRIDFGASPKDSIEVMKQSIEAMTEDSPTNLKIRPSKLITAKDSVEMLKHSKSLLKETPCIRKEAVRKSRSVVSWNSLKDASCCDKCLKSKESVEVVDGAIIHKKMKNGSFDDNRSIKVAHIEVINIDREQNKSNVSFQPLPIVYEAGGGLGSEQLARLYQKPHKVPKKPQKPVKDKLLSLPKTTKIIGDTQAKEYLQKENEFTIDRIHSLISLMKDHPDLIRTFTACTR